MARLTVTKNRGETIIQRPNMVRCRYELNNGQLLTVYFKRRRNRGQAGALIVYVWTVGLHIGRSRKEANAWWHGWKKQSIRQTGECGLEALVVASKYIRAFGMNICKARSEMQIGWADNKRMRAYHWLLRYPGFTWYADETDKGQCIAFRNPDYYEWIPRSGKSSIEDPDG